jgi:hypothetical protein
VKNPVKFTIANIEYPCVEMMARPIQVWQKNPTGVTLKAIQQYIPW